MHVPEFETCECPDIKKSDLGSQKDLSSHENPNLPQQKKYIIFGPPDGSKLRVMDFFIQTLKLKIAPKGKYGKIMSFENPEISITDGPWITNPEDPVPKKP
jgi:hypothetical protein